MCFDRERVPLSVVGPNFDCLVLRGTGQLVAQR